eukprot:m.9008 g.9008  ORF g.9008 m.9008 type:complete len:54 (+) comp4127_c0_seq1:2142-2303(+)
MGEDEGAVAVDGAVAVVDAEERGQEAVAAMGGAVVDLVLKIARGHKNADQTRF